MMNLKRFFTAFLAVYLALFAVFPVSPAFAEEAAAETEPLALTVTKKTYSAFAARTAMKVLATVSGGTAPYTLSCTISLYGETVHSKSFTLNQAGGKAISYTPSKRGKYKISCTVTDAAGKSRSDSVTIPVAVRTYESKEDWEATMSNVTLTGDWRDDVVAIALSQLGYEESTVNFEITSSGSQKGYTRYGHWIGAEYTDWCAAFVSFCYYYAGVKQANKLKSASVKKWIENAKSLDVYREVSSYIPAKGDVVFTSDNDEDVAGHMGIIMEVTDEGLITIEGNLSNAVGKKERLFADNNITGYASIRELMILADVWPEAIIELGHVESVEPFTVRTLKTNVILRKDPFSDAAKGTTVAKKGTELTVTGTVIANSIRWYLVDYKDQTLYVRVDLVETVETEEK